MQFQKLQSKQLSQDYICWRLAKSGHYQWPILDNIDVNKNNRNKLFLCMRSLAHRFEIIYNSNFVPLGAQFHLTSTNCRDTYFTISDQLFLTNDDREEEEERGGGDAAARSPADDASSPFTCHWGKIVGLFAFSGSLAVRCFEKDMGILVYHIIDWLTEYLNNRKFVSKWIITNSSWGGFVDYFYQNNEYLNIRVDSYLLDLDVANRGGGSGGGGSDKKSKKASLASAFAKHRPRMSSSSGGQSSIKPSSNSSNRRLNSQDSLEQKFVSKKGGGGGGSEEVAIGVDDQEANHHDDQEEADAHVTYLSKGSGGGSSKLKKTARTAFCEMSKYAGIAFGSLGVLTLGAMYIKK